MVITTFTMAKSFRHLDPSVNILGGGITAEWMAQWAAAENGEDPEPDIDSSCTEAVFTDIFGEPDTELSPPPELYFCDGAVLVHLMTGRWYDFENKHGGNTRDAIRLFRKIVDLDAQITFAKQCLRNFENGKEAGGDVILDAPITEPPTPQSNGGELHPMLAARLAYAARGWETFPADISFDEKTGKFKKKSYKSAEFSNGAKWGKTKDPDVIRQDFRKFPDANVAIPTGPENGIIVVETDTKKGHDVDGDASLAQLEQEHGKLPDTLMAMSPSESKHRYFNHPGAGIKVNTTASVIGPGIDVRGDGGMVIAPPSIRDDGVYRWINDLPIADAPPWLIDLVTSKSSGKGNVKKPRLEMAQAFKGLDLKNNLGAGIERPPPIKIDDIIKEGGCGWLRHVHTTGGADQTESLWKMALNCGPFLEEPEKRIHELSKGHPGYDPAKTETKFNEALQAKRTLDLGYPKCETIAKTGATQCKNCPHFEKHLAEGKSPLHLAKQQKPEGIELQPTTETEVDWTKVKQPGWLRSAADLPDDVPAKLRCIIAHTGNLTDSNNALIEGGHISDLYKTWYGVTLAVTAGLKFYGRYTPEQIAEEALANLPCNQHITGQKNKRRAIERVIAQSHGPEEIAGVTFRDYDRYGKPKPSLANAVIAIRALGIGVRLDLFRQQMEVTYKGEAKTIAEGLLTDETISAVRSLINNTYRIDCGDNYTLAAIKEVARDNAFDPILDLLDACQAKWDGVKRIDTWVKVYLGCEDTPLHRAIGRIALIAQCRRARVPGCKFDQIIVEEGPEGKNKSTSIRVLAGDEFFSDEPIIGVPSKEVQEQLGGVWVHENADLDGMRRAEITKVKTFARRQVDRARPAYGRVRANQPRRSVEWGTTNEEQYLLSQTGNRCFWLLKTGKINLEALIRDRDKLLGEAATYEAAGTSIVLDEKLWDAAKDAQEQRRVTDPWEDILTNIPDEVIYKGDDEFERVASARVLEHVLQIPRAQQSSYHGQRLATAMKRIGWERKDSGLVTIDGKSVRGYARRKQPPKKTRLRKGVRKAPPAAEPDTDPH